MSDVTHGLYGRQLGDFTLRDCLDEGGFGAVYRCEQPLLGREAVVKVMHQRVQADEDARRRFSAEARLAARLEHPYAAHIYAYGIEEDGLVWIAMELVGGSSLKQHLDDHGPMPLDAFVPFFERLAEVVHAAHEQGIVHRDLKPANVMVHRSMPKLLDFGVAKLLGNTAREAAGLPREERDDATQRTRTGDLTPRDALIGTPAYSSPEIWLGNDVGPAVDIYALGVIAFEALTGRRPFRAETFQAYGAAHLTGPIPRVGVPALDRIFARALAKRPEDRYDTALEFAAALRSVLDGQTRRRAAQRMGAWIGALLAAVVLAGGVGKAQYERRMAEQRAADAAETARATAITAEVEQGRAALLHDELGGAQQYLGEAWRSGDHSSPTAFMYARALQPLRAELARLPAVQGRMWSASWSPDGRQIVTTDDRAAQIWNAETHQLLFPLPHEDTVYDAQYTADGRRVVTACGDGAVRVWDTARGDLVHELRLHGKAPRWALVAVDGRHTAAIDFAGAVAAVWDISTGAALAEIELDGKEWLSIAFSPDSRWLAAGGGDTVQVIDTRTWRRAVTIPGPRIHAAAWEPTRSRLVTGSAGGDASVWNIPGGARERRLREVGDPVDAVAVSPDGRLIAVAARDGAEQVFSEGGELVSHGNYLHTKLFSIGFDARSEAVVSAGTDGSVAVSEALDGLPLTVLNGPAGVVRTARFDPSGRRVVGASWDGAVRVWDASSPYRRWTAPTIADGCGLVGGAVPDGPVLAVACPGHVTRVWDTANDRLLAELPPVAVPRGDAPAVYPVAAGGRAAIARGDAVELYALPGGRPAGSVAHHAAVTAIGMEPDGTLVSGAADGSVLVSAAGGEPRELAPAPAGIDAVALLADERVAVADARGHLRVLDRFGVVADVALPARARFLRSSPDGRSVIAVPRSVGVSAPPVLVDADRGGVVARLDGPQTYAARWVDDGRHILTAHADGAARLWDADGRLVRVFRGGTRFLGDADLYGSMVVGGGGDGLLRFWDVQSGRQLWVTPAHSANLLGVYVELGDVVTRGSAGELARWRLPDSASVITADYSERSR